MDLSDRVELRWLSAILSDARDVAPDVDFLVVGAMARDLLLHVRLQTNGTEECLS